MMKKLIIALLLGCALLATWYAITPGMALRGLRDAALEGDIDELNERVDFASVRENLRASLRAAMIADMTSPELADDPFAGLGMALGGAMVDGVIDALVSPQGIAAFTSAMPTERMLDSLNAGPPPEPVDVEIDRRGFSRFHVLFPDAEEESAELVFRRAGLGWELSRIDLPPFE